MSNRTLALMVAACVAAGAAPNAASPVIQTVVSAEAFGGFSSIAPGTWIEIYGSNLGPTVSQTWSSADFNGNEAPTGLGGTSVTIGGQSAFMYYASSGQVNVQVASNVPMGTQPVVVTTSSGSSSAFNVTVNATQPGLLAPPSFVFNGQQYAVALVSGTSTYALPFPVSGIATAAPSPGASITLYGVGFGPVTPDIPAGEIVAGSNALASFQIYFAGVPATVTYAGLAPGFVGLYQFNVVVPNVAPGSAVPLTFSLNGNPGSQTLVTVVQTFSTAANLQLVSGNNQTTPVNQSFSAPLVVSVTDNQGSPVSGATVRFSVASGAASLNPASAATNAQGMASTLVTAGASAGPIGVTASLNALSAKFSLTSTAQGPATNVAYVYLVSGNQQAGPPGSTFPIPIVVQALDVLGNPVAGASVSFVASAGLTLSSPVAVTDAQGHASTMVTAGPVPGQYVITASSGSASATFTMVVNAQAAYIQIVSGNNQTAIVNTGFALPLVVRVNDAQGQPVAAANITLSVVSGTATVNPVSEVTNVQGQASFLVTAGSSAGPITVSATYEGFQVSFSLTAVPPGPLLTAASFQNAASFQTGLAPCGLAVATGSGLAPGISGTIAPPSSGPLPYTLAGLSLTVNGTQAPISQVSNMNGTQQVTFQTPCEVAGSSTATVVVQINGGLTTVAGVSVLEVQPGIYYSTGAGGKAYAQVLDSNGNYLSATNPAKRGQTYYLVATGLGQVTPAAKTNAVGTPGQTVNLAVIVGVSNVGVPVVEQIYQPGAIGLYLVGFTIPLTNPTGADQALALAVILNGVAAFGNTAYLNSVQ